MNAPPPETDDGRLRSSILTDPWQRQVLAVLRARSGPLTDRDLAVEIAGGDASPSDVADEEIRRLLLVLHHQCLPKLERIGWIDRRPDGVVITEQFPFDDPEVPLHPSSGSDTRLGMSPALFAHPHSQYVASVLARRDRPLSLTELAADLADRDLDWPAASDADDLALTLHHVDLPRLAEAGLIGYDPDERRIDPAP